MGIVTEKYKEYEMQIEITNKLNLQTKKGRRLFVREQTPS